MPAWLRTLTPWTLAAMQRAVRLGWWGRGEGHV